ncbi:hypothetical protein [Stappia indica]|uniref:von Hippel-Lindau disease tumour suppressor beta domain-containing protein n=1 Tax=Stappia indica TaxID=538381 RepID=A0A857C921_9HYPH|nr:hypothetical protein [Stappia indica]QGZ35387.1 hypothetical protein GH266_13315 [Stappia indica]
MHQFRPVACLSAAPLPASRRLPRAGIAVGLAALIAALLSPLPAPAQGSGETAGSGSGQRVQRRLVMIQTDDDTAIREVEMDGKAMQVRRRAEARVFVEVEGDAKNDGQIDCRRSLRLVLADGRILRDEVDICGDWKVTMATKGAASSQADAGARGVRQAVPSGAGPSAPPRAGGVRRPSVDGSAEDGLRGSRDEAQAARETPATAAEDAQTRQDEAAATAQVTQNGDQDEARDVDPPQDLAGVQPGLPLFEGRNWYVEDLGGDRLQLVYGLRQTDDRALRASCQRGSNRIEMQLAATADPLAENQQIAVQLSARDVSRSYTARGSSANNEAGQSEPVVTLTADDPIWTGMIRGETLDVGIAGNWRYKVSLSGSAQPVRSFQQACATPAPVVAAPQMTRGLPVAGGSGGISCYEEGDIASVPSDRPARMIFVNDRNRPVIVHWLDFDGLRQTQAEVPPGGRMIQDTLAGHPWLVSNLRGRCLGIYLAGGGTRTVTIPPGMAEAEPAPVYRPAPPPQFLPPEPLPSGDVLPLSYDCDSGAYLDVTIDNARRTATVRERGLSPVTLPDRSGGGGELNYVGRGYALTGSGNTVTWQRPGMPPQFCRIF